MEIGLFVESAYFRDLVDKVEDNVKSVQPFHPVVSPSTCAIAGWMATNKPSTPHSAIAAGLPDIVQPPVAVHDLEFFLFNLRLWTYGIIWPADKPLTRRNATGVIGAELRNNPNPTIRPCGVAACLAAVARFNRLPYLIKLV
ncbi:late embryogenesis abundant protein 47 [Artemisia annua]|uniref:Late embryogenesis abundant protein 47 n=1 Tax=Artemisia annua TaxID=35608 RepID=A0A2U1Q7B8_ARTAN|nr:late embryogenesis abundant protein 47 [Artemisia annua]